MKKEVISKNNFRCLSPAMTSGKIKKLQKILEKNQNFETRRKLAETISGEMRGQVLFLLSREPWLSVGDIADILKSSVSSTSHQLRILRKENLVRTKKKEKLMLYTLNERLPQMLVTFLQ